MKYFLLRLLPPRPSFAVDMSDAEKKAMGEHVAYWTDLADKGIAILFGPVADPDGMWGLGVVRVEDEAKARSLADHDPAILAAVGLSYEVLWMPRAMIGSDRKNIDNS